MVAGIEPGLTTGRSNGSMASASAVDQSLLLAQQVLIEAVVTADIARRYVCAHVAALRAAAAVIADRTGSSSHHGRRRRNAWELVREVAPELDEWVMVFEASARKRAIAEAGVASAVTAREADDLVRDAEAFLVLVEKVVGAPAHLPLDQRVRWV